MRNAKLLLSSVVLAAAVFSRAAIAQDAAAAAEVLFVQGKALTDEGKWADACPKFEASYKLDKQLGTLLNLADCETHIDRPASAWAHFGEALEMAKKANDNRSEYATKRRDALAPELPMLTLKIQNPVATLDVLRDGVKIEPGAYGVPLPTDPGKHTISVRRGSQVLKEQSSTMAPKGTATIELDLAAIDKAVPAVADAGWTGPPPTGQRTAGFVIGAIGVLTIGAAGALEIVALSNKSTANQPDACVNKYCTPSGLDAASRARTFANVGQWVGIGGILVTAVGVTLLITAPSQRAAPKTGLVTSLRVTAGPGSASIGGSF